MICVKNYIFVCMYTYIQTILQAILGCINLSCSRLNLRFLELGITKHLPVFSNNPSSVCVDWTEGKWNDHLGSCKASRILCSFFFFFLPPPVLPFSKRGVQRRTGPFLQIPKPWLRWGAVFFCSNGVILPLVHVNVCFPHHETFHFFFSF